MIAVIDAKTGNTTLREMTPEEVAALPPVLPAPIPQLVTPRQAKLALFAAGLLDDVEAAIDAIAEPATKRVAQIEWEYAHEIRRDWPLLLQVAGAMGMTAAELDALFVAAAGL
ncbi:MAG: hypothetical protein RBR38_10300 [Desulfomicrobium apsheronum]|nr:hypothetical protein [Desulfomicrobium apsheronum]